MVYYFYSLHKYKNYTVQLYVDSDYGVMITQAASSSWIPRIALITDRLSGPVITREWVLRPWSCSARIDAEVLYFLLYL